MSTQTWIRSIAALITATSMLVVGAGCSDDGDVIENEPFQGELGTILFVTQVPVGGLDSIAGHFTNHLARTSKAPRGGDLMLRYPDGTLRNLTREAGFGDAGEMQGDSAIAVRQPTVHWSGNKALFSMVVGSVTRQFSHDQDRQFRWQIYEVTGFGRNETASITKVPGQPEGYNNLSPIYGSDDRILFTSDRPLAGAAHLYPQLDEYESQPTNTGIWAIVDGELSMIENSPSGAFSLSLDSHGRVIFTKWDHLQRDQQGDSPDQDGAGYIKTYASEAADAEASVATAGAEVFPEPRTTSNIDYDPTYEGHTYNHFFPWQVNQDGTEEETLNHVGRQEWGGSYTEGSFRDDDNLSFEASGTKSAASTQLPADGGAFFLREDPTDPGWFLAVRAKEFGTGNAGRLIRLEGDPAVNPEDMRLESLTARDGDGLYRNPLRLADGTLLAAHTANEGGLNNEGSLRNPDWNYDFRIVVLEEDGDGYAAGAPITEGIERTVTWLSPDEEVTWSGTLWELDPVEVAPRERPPLRQAELPGVEVGVFDEVGVVPETLSAWLRDRDLALLVSRNVTMRDRNDVQQPYNLRVPGGTEAIAADGAVYEVSRIQFFQGDQVRGYGDDSGRRILARPMHGPDLITDADGPAGSVSLGLDGSFAAFVPARRAMSWQLVGADDGPVVRERNWVSFAPGEIRVCAACHGVNKETQTGAAAPVNEPEALRSLLESWKATQ